MQLHHSLVRHNLNRNSQSLVAFGLPLLRVFLIHQLLLHPHPLPHFLFPLIQEHQPSSLAHHHKQRQRTDRNQHLIPPIVIRLVVLSVYLTANHAPDLHDHVVRGGGEGAFLDVEAVLADPRGEDGVEVGVAADHGGEGEARPGVAVRRQREQGSEQGQDPEFADDAVQGPLVEVFGGFGEGEHEDDLEDGGGDGQHVAVERAEADALEGQTEVALHGCGWDVGDEPEKVHAPHGVVAPGGFDVGPGGGFFEGGETFGRVVSEEAVDHDGFFAFRIPLARTEERFSVDDRLWEIENREDTNKKGEKTLGVVSVVKRLELPILAYLQHEQPEPPGFPTDSAQFKNTCSEETRDDTGDIESRPEDCKARTELTGLVEIRGKQDGAWNKAPFASADQRTSDVERGAVVDEGLCPRYSRPHHHEDWKDVLEPITLRNHLDWELRSKKAHQLNSKTI